MNSKKRTLLLTIILALLTTGLGYMYINQAVAASSAAPAIEMAEVVVPLSTIPAHVQVTQEMVEVKAVPAEAVHDQALTTVEDVVGTTTKAELYAGEQILKERLVLEETDAALSYRIPETMRAVTIPTSEVSAVAGYISQGDRVDILVTYSRELEGKTETIVYTQLQNVEVLATGPYVSSAEGSAAGVPSSLTILVNPQQAEVVAYATLNGSFHLTLRNPADTEKATVDSYGTPNFDSWKER